MRIGLISTQARLSVCDAKESGLPAHLCQVQSIGCMMAVRSMWNGIFCGNGDGRSAGTGTLVNPGRAVARELLLTHLPPQPSLSPASLPVHEHVFFPGGAPRLKSCVIMTRPLPVHANPQDTCAFWVLRIVSQCPFCPALMPSSHMDCRQELQEVMRVSGRILWCYSRARQQQHVSTICY